MFIPTLPNRHYLKEWIVVLAELLAILGAFLFSLGNILIRRGLTDSDFLSSIMVTTLVSNFVFWILAFLLVPLDGLNLTSVVLFFLAGLFIPGLVRLTLWKGIETLGASMNASIFAIHPLFGSFFAFLILGEHPSMWILVGTICTICGVVLIERDIHTNSGKASSPSRMALALPLLASLINGFGFVLSKMGLNAYDEPIAGNAISNLSSLCLYTLVLALSTPMRSSMSVNRRSVQNFWMVGLIIGAAHLVNYYALGYGDVSTITPLMNVQPFFVFILAFLFLRELEKITYKLVLGTLIIVTGVTLITLF